MKMKNIFFSVVLTVFTNLVFGQTNDAQFISQTVPVSVSEGDTFSVSVTFKNTGTTTWQTSNNYHLGTQAPQDNNNWGIGNRVDLPYDVAPNQEVIFNINLIAPQNGNGYGQILQWQMVQDGVEWFGEKSELKTIIVGTIGNADSLMVHKQGFAVTDKIVATSFFPWYGDGSLQFSGPWIPLEGRDAWDGSVDYWKSMIKQIMAANIDVIYILVIPIMHESRINLFRALQELRREGWDVPKVCPFFDPTITYSILGYNGDASTASGKDEIVSHYITFYNDYYSQNTDDYADDYIYTQDGHPVLNVWHVYLNIDNYDQLTRSDVTSRLSAALGTEHPIFNNSVKMITTAVSPSWFADEKLHQFEAQQYRIEDTYNGITSALLKAGYWDQNIRNPGYCLKRDGGIHYVNAWDSISANVTRVCVESFNEYDEGSGIYAARTDTIYKKTDDGMNNTENDVWSTNNDPFEYIKTSASGAAQFNNVQPLNAKILWHNIPSTMLVNDTVIATIIVRNEGDEQWNAANNFKFGEMEFLDDTLFGPSRYLMNDSDDEIPVYGGVFRGRTKIFNIQVVAPSTPGIYTTHWGMLQEGYIWFGDTLTHQITVYSNTRVNNNNIDNDFEIYPNPANNSLRLIMNNEQLGKNIKILDSTGKTILNFSAKKAKQSVDISNLQKGIYFIKVDTSIKKFIKE